MHGPDATHRVARHADVAAFLAAARGYLDADECLRTLVYGLAALHERWPASHPEGLVGWTVHAREREDAVVGAALWTPPRRPLALTDLDAPAASALLQALGTEARAPTRWNGPEPAIAALVAARTARGAAPPRTAHRFLLYRLDRLAPAPAVRGRLRRAEERDRELVRAWLRDFLRETGLAAPDAPAPAELPALDQGRAHLWEVDGEPVGTASWSRPTPHAVSIGFVYVPPERRGHGYGGAVTHALTAERLATGLRFTTLFTDRTNAHTNALYPRLGYRKVAPFHEVALEGDPGYRN